MFYFIMSLKWKKIKKLKNYYFFFIINLIFWVILKKKKLKKIKIYLLNFYKKILKTFFKYISLN